MKLKSLWVLSASFVLSFGLGASCGGQPKCDQKSCSSGCCDAQDKCQVGGSSPQACGLNGITCAVCQFGQQCQLGQCVTLSTGSGGGTTSSGGGSATTGGGTTATGGGSANGGGDVGGGTATTGGGTATTGGGTATTGGGTATTGGGTATTGGGTATTGGGSATTGGGTATTGGGSATTGGGSATTGGGSATTGGGTATTGGGSATTGGGSATTGGGSNSTGGGTGGLTDYTLAQVRTATQCTQKVRVSGVIVTAIEQTSLSGGNTRASFWVADPANPTAAIFVFKDYTDSPTTYSPTEGDILTIEGYLSPAKSFLDRTGYRDQLRSGCAAAAGCSCNAAAGLPMTITQMGARAPLADNTAPTGFGAGLQANNNYLGARVFIPGPLTLSAANPPEFRRISAVPNDPVYFGFAVSGSSVPAGVLVNNFKTFGTGIDRCDWRAAALDGGTVTFPNGIHGVWDTYTHAPCADGGTSSSCFRNNGFIPGTAALTTNVLYPLNCPVDLPGTVQ